MDGYGYGYGYGYGSGQRPYGGDRRMEIVSGKSFSSGNHVYGGNDMPPIQARVTRPTNGAPLKVWGMTDPEMKRKKRIAKYKVYTVEGKAKASLRKGFRWIKNKCSQIVHW